MQPIKPREEMTRQELVSFILRHCALRCDPRHGRLRVLAAQLQVHEVTISVWIAKGYVPFEQAKKLEKKFGRSCAPANDLCPTTFRR
ncbi:MAG: hypothetical protein DDT26_00275 [Dehalococcoidia bacterium]|nr:hypothetical protein [Chloroflexota bacterium]